MSLINPGASFFISTSTALLISFAILLTNDYISKLNIRYTKIRDWKNVIILPYEKTLKESMIDKKIDQKEAEQLKQVYSHYVDKRKETMNSNKFKVEDVLGVVISKDSSTTEQITKLKNF